MTPTAEVLTMDKKGLADFIHELKREQYRHRVPFETFLEKFAKVMSKKPKAKRVTAEVGYARYIDANVAAWEARQAETVTNAADAAKAARVKRAEEDDDFDPDISFKASLDRTLAGIDHSRGLASAFASIRFYLGELNRDVNDNRVASYAGDMENGKWWFTPDPIVVAKEGSILNGQHRLLAIERLVNAKDDVKTWPQFVVVWGVDKRAAILMDEARRTASDRRDIALRFARSA